MYHSNDRQPLDILFVLLTAFLLISTACLFSSSPGSAPDSTRSASATTPSSWYEVNFTDPGGIDSQTLRGGPDDDLADAIRDARVSVDVAVLRLDLWSIRDVLIDAHWRGLAIRIVVDSDYLDEDEIQDMIAVGIPILGDRSEGTMHNKFTVIDRRQVWTGSMNYTVGDAYKNNNNMVRIDSIELAENYTSEFEEMFLDDRFGAGSPATTPHPALNIQGVKIENCFAPEDGCQALLVDLVHRARKSIQFLAFSFTSDDLASAMLERAKAGVSVIGVFDRDQYYSNSGTEFDNFRDAGLDVRLDGNPYNMHHKVIIIDERIVVTGSYNFTFSAENRNDENLLIIYSSEIARLYLSEFQNLWNESE